ncbi:hypothetical protein MTR67_012033 [Solanum verrucosum]|uniref:Uncharacterized protein n=1 Tax=Solanum verrucosum TaxID=315347 RepID=A0AAF0Q9L3_SOLVR|nr:hypothetical protein MTR67_012033 [Solanum verrucosum]
MSVLNHPGKANVVADAISHLSMNNVSHVEEGKKEFVCDVHRLTKLGVQLVESNGGAIFVHNGPKSSYVPYVKVNQGHDMILVELKEAMLKKSVEAFFQLEDNFLRYQRVTKMYHDLREIYWWDGMKRDIAEFVDKCPNCQQVKFYHQKPEASYYRRFVEGFSSISSPLTKLNQKTVKFQWSKACDKSFQELKKRLTTTPVLTLPEGTQGFMVYCDACRVGLGCGLMQNGKVIAYASRQLKSRQKSYTDVRRSPLEFEVDDWVYLKVSPMKGGMRFGKKGKLNPRYIGPYRIAKRIGSVA